MDKKKILIIDDEKDLLSVLAKELRAEEYSVITASNGGDAIVSAESEHPDLIILDLLMPDVDGAEVSVRLKENVETKDIPVIFLTGLYLKEEEMEKGHMFGGSAMFAKPYDREELLSTIKELTCEKEYSLNKKSTFHMDKKKILIVDDEKDALTMLAKELEIAGFSVIPADSGNDAVMLAKSERPDLIILDWLMPDIDGAEVSVRLKENVKTKDIPVIFLTGLYPKEEEVEKGHMLGGNATFAKPYNKEELVSAIKELICEKDNIA